MTEATAARAHTGVGTLLGGTDRAPHRGAVLAVAGRYVFYPRTLAPGTLADDLEWREIDGAGTLYTFTVAADPPARRGPTRCRRCWRWSSGMPVRGSAPNWSTSTRPTSGSACASARCSATCPTAEVTLLRYRPERTDV